MMRDPLFPLSLLQTAAGFCSAGRQNPGGKIKRERKRERERGERGREKYGLG